MEYAKYYQDVLTIERDTLINLLRDLDTVAMDRIAELLT